MSIFVWLVFFIFWRFFYACALSYHEQNQLFLFDGDYFMSRLIEPGGFARYIAEFLVQFYNNVTLGALVISLIYFLIQQLVWFLAKKEKAKAEDGIYTLSFIPSFALWLYMGDVNVMMTYVISLLLSLIFLLLCPKGKYISWVYCILGSLVCYFLLGPIVFMLPVYLLTKSCFSESKQSGLIKAAVTLIVIVSITLVTAVYLPFTTGRLFRGIDYYRYMDIIPYIQYFVAILTAFVPVIIAYVPNKPGKKFVKESLSFTVLVALIVAFMPKMYDSKTYELLEYDYMVRLRNWDGIIAKAEKQQPNLPMSVCATNLAMGMTGQLGERVFDFYQNGVAGLLPPFERSSTSTLITGEAYYHLGLINTAQRFAFEAQEAIPNYNKSCRLVRRLAETNIINGNYGVARKYLRLLKKTLFYSKWATAMEATIEFDRKAFDNHPEYGIKRKGHLLNDFLFSEREVDKMFGQLYVKNNTNNLAKQYLLVYPLLERDLQKFMQYLPIVETHENYNPRAIQEGLVMACMHLKQQPPRGFVDQITGQRFQEFAQTYTQQGKNSPQLEAFRNTFWYYFMKK